MDASPSKALGFDMSGAITQGAMQVRLLFFIIPLKPRIE